MTFTFKGGSRAGGRRMVISLGQEGRMDRDVWGCVSVTLLREPMPSLRAGGECL